MIKCFFSKHIDGRRIDHFLRSLMHAHINGKVCDTACASTVYREQCETNRKLAYNLRRKEMRRAQNGDGEQTANMRRQTTVVIKIPPQCMIFWGCFSSSSSGNSISYVYKSCVTLLILLKSALTRAMRQKSKPEFSTAMKINWFRFGSWQ